jgi:GxxExxY protein
VALDCGYKLDLIVEEKVIVELKAIEQLTWIHEAQLLTYLRLTGLRVGLVINFNVPVLKQGIRRVMNTRWRRRRRQRVSRPAGLREARQRRRP